MQTAEQQVMKRPFNEIFLRIVQMFHIVNSKK